jgi:hypothetical protein
MTDANVSPSSRRWHPAGGITAGRRSLSRTECLLRLQDRTIGRLAMTAGALPHIAVIRYYLIRDTVFIDMGSAEVARSISGHVVALESGTSDADRQHEIWTVCAVGVPTPSAQAPVGETILAMHPELVSGWVETLVDPDGDSQGGVAKPPDPPRAH